MIFLFGRCTVMEREATSQSRVNCNLTALRKRCEQGLSQFPQRGQMQGHHPAPSRGSPRGARPKLHADLLRCRSATHEAFPCVSPPPPVHSLGPSPLAVNMSAALTFLPLARTSHGGFVLETKRLGDVTWCWARTSRHPVCTWKEDVISDGPGAVSATLSGNGEKILQ